LEAGVNKEPLTIKGAFVHDTDTSAIDGSKTESYRGGVAVGLKAWNLLAVGEYKIVTPKVGSQYKSVFMSVLPLYPTEKSSLTRRLDTESLMGLW
jgi:hypothetical protein